MPAWAKAFSGVFDGNGYTISNFRMGEVADAGTTANGTWNMGIIGYNTGVVRNLRVETAPYSWGTDPVFTNSLRTASGAIVAYTLEPVRGHRLEKSPDACYEPEFGHRHVVFRPLRPLFDYIDVLVTPLHVVVLAGILFEILVVLQLLVEGTVLGNALQIYLALVLKK